ncbi:MAG: tryptophan synthase subunit alpha [Propionibacteriaceae bacterium]|jgi:tryptophan synthase alpha chain|nr:tryptophan synthase subunit alpha [Propionibacteriaceae bacterium]
MGPQRIRQAFTDKAFIAFITGGDPTLDDTRRYINLLARLGVGLVEIGLPFSDPIAEGPIIQAASQRALASGTTPEAIFDLVNTLRQDDALTIPLAIMTYLNPLHHYGYDAWFARANAVGLDAVIIPDLPFEEHDEVRAVASHHNVALISMVAPTTMQAERRSSSLDMPRPKQWLTSEARSTSSDRIRRIAQKAEGFIYLVSSLGVTGVRSEITTDLAAIVAEIRAVTDTPVAVGFGISTPAQVAVVSKQADGVIVGSAIVRLIAEGGGRADPAIEEYVRSMIDAL